MEPYIVAIFALSIGAIVGMFVASAFAVARINDLHQHYAEARLALVKAVDEKEGELRRFRIGLNGAHDRVNQLSLELAKERDMKKSSERTSKRIAKIAAKGLVAPGSLSPAEIRTICGSCLTQKERDEIKKADRDKLKATITALVNKTAAKKKSAPKS